MTMLCIENRCLCGDFIKSDICHTYLHKMLKTPSRLISEPVAPHDSAANIQIGEDPTWSKCKIPILGCALRAFKLYMY